MKAFWTLVWLHLQNSKVLLFSLLGLIALVAVFALFSALELPWPAALDQLTLILSFLFFVGAGIVVAWLVLEHVLLTKDGHRQFLQCSPSSTYVQVLAPFAFFTSVLFVFWVGITLVSDAIFWLTARGDLYPLEAGHIFYILVVGIFPAIAWTLLLREFIAAFAPGWNRAAAAFTYLAGTAALLWGLVSSMPAILFKLPGWFGEGEFALPQEPFWAALIATALFLVVAGRIRWEVEL